VMYRKTQLFPGPRAHLGTSVPFSLIRQSPQGMI
jgi:hypothetical protein